MNESEQRRQQKNLLKNGLEKVTKKVIPKSFGLNFCKKFMV